MTHVWSKAGYLNTSRKGHNVIFDGRHFLVIGGYETKKEERCTIVRDEMTCVEQAPELTDYAYYPELFLVPDDFCKKSNWNISANKIQIIMNCVEQNEELSSYARSPV